MEEKIIDGKVFIKTLVHRFILDYDIDVGIYVGSDIYDWEQSEQGAWVMANSAMPPEIKTYENIEKFCWDCAIFAYLTASDITYFKLKWGN